MRTNKCSVAVRNKQILRLGFHPNRGLGPQNQGVGCYLPLEPNGLPTNSRYHSTASRNQMKIKKT